VINELESIIPLTIAKCKFGIGATEELGYELRTLGCKKVMLVVDPHLWEFDLVDRVKTIIEKERMEITIFDGIHFEPNDASLQRAIARAQEFDFDAIVALGGGSTIDTAKAMNLFATHPADLYDYINVPIGKGRMVPGPLKPLITLPTTSGGGAEITPVIVLDLLELHVKTGISHPYICPALAIVDPLNMLSAPPAVTAGTGVDVLTHAVESFTTKPYNTRPKPQDPSIRPTYIGANPVSDTWSEKAIEWIGKYLRRAVFNGNDLEARNYVAMAATFAGIGFGNAGVHIPHALAYPIAGMVRDWIPPGYDVDEPIIPHGISAVLTLPACVRFTAPTNYAKHARIAELLGVDTARLTPIEAALRLPDTLIQLMKDIGLPNGLNAVGYTEADIPQLVEGGWQQPRLLVGSPRPVTRDDLSRILGESLQLW
jgi:alcohol dehydrogenase class IV